MGVNADAFVVIGFEVAHEDFWEPSEDVFTACQNGHRGGVEGHYCHHCGTKIETYREQKPTAKYATYLSRFRKGVSPEHAWDPDPRSYFDERVAPSEFRDFELRCVDAYTSPEDRRRHLVLGKEVLGVRNILGGGRGTLQAMDEKQLRMIFQEASELSFDLGVHRPVKLFLSGRVG